MHDFADTTGDTSYSDGPGDELAAARQGLVRAAVGGIAPPRQALALLDAWADELVAVPAGGVSAEQFAHAWGNLQLILIECGPETAGAVTTAGDTAPAWQRVRRSAEQGFSALFARPEWASLQGDAREEVLPHLADTVTGSRLHRIARCTEAVQHLRALAHRTSGQPHAWIIARVAEMQYPLVGPAGWLARAGSDFTWRRAQAVVQAMIEHLQQQGLGTVPLVIGYDSRVHADQLAALAAEVASAYGQPVHLCSRDLPTPALLAYLTESLGVAHNAGLLMCTASHHPVKETGTGVYTGTEYQGLRYFTPYGGPAPAAMGAWVSRHAAELLLEERHLPAVSPPGVVTMINPLVAYQQRLLAGIERPLTLPDGGEVNGRTAIRAYWRQAGAVIVIDEMYGAGRGVLREVCEQLELPCEILHGDRNPVLGELSAAQAEPPYLASLGARLRDLREDHGPLIGLAFDADADRLGVMDETGAFLPGDAVLALLTDFLLHEASSGEPGLVARTHVATRMIDRLAQEDPMRTTAPQQADGLPGYMRAPGYRQLAGDPRRLHGGGVSVVPGGSRELAQLVMHEMEAVLERQRAGTLTAARVQDIYRHHLEELCIAGDERGGYAGGGNSAYRDAGWAALLLLQLCAVRQAPLGELWRQLQARVGPAATARLELDAPNNTGMLLVNREMERYGKASEGQLDAKSYQLAGTTVRYAGGQPDTFIEWALLDAQGEPAYLTVLADLITSRVAIHAEATSLDLANRLLLAVAERLEALIVEQLKRADTPWKVVDILAETQLPVSVAAELPGTLNCRLVQHAYSRLQELAHPGREAPELMRFVTDRLSELHPEKGRVLTACHFTTRPADKRPPVPKVEWEGEE